MLISAMRFELLLMRHGQAVDYAPGGDALRELTDRGRDEVAHVGQVLRALKLVPSHAVASPLQRAQETAGLVCAATGADAQAIETEPMLVPSAPTDRVIATLVAHATRTAASRLLAVGHNPSVTATAGALLSNHTSIAFAVAPGDVAHFSVEAGKAAPRCVLLGFYPRASLCQLRPE